MPYMRALKRSLDGGGSEALGRGTEGVLLGLHIKVAGQPSQIPDNPGRTIS